MDVNAFRQNPSNLVYLEQYFRQHRYFVVIGTVPLYPGNMVMPYEYGINFMGKIKCLCKTFGMYSLNYNKFTSAKTLNFKDAYIFSVH